jgi:enoyl-CoA hydratase/carnithine racemase
MRPLGEIAIFATRNSVAALLLHGGKTPHVETGAEGADARMSIMEIKWGLVPDMAGTPILASLVRDDILRDLTYTGRIFSAQEAVTYGLATRICDDPRAAALEVAREIAGKSPDAIRAAKRLLNNLSVDPGPALLAESVEQQKLIGSPNQTEAVRSNLEKRAAKFAD